MQKEILEYQKLDSELRKIKKELESNEFYVKGRQLQAKRRDIETLIAKLDGKAVELKSALAQADKTAQDLDAFLSDYSDAISNANSESELNFIKKKLAERTNALAAAERECKRIYAECNDASKQYDQALAELNKVVATLRSCNEEFSKATTEVEPKIKQIKAKQAELEKAISPDLLKEYKHKLEQKIFPVYVKAMQMGKDYSCRCGVQLLGASAISLENDKIATCESCHRIIYID